MSYESTYRPGSGLIAKIRQAVFGLPQEPPKYAHPWSAYSPANFQNDNVAQNIVKTKTPNTFFPSIGETISEAGNVTETAPTKSAEPTQTHPLIATSSRNPVEVSVIERVILKLVAQQTKKKSADLQPTLVTASGVDFQLAARLKSVSILNRKVTAAAAKSAARRSGINRPVKPPVVSKRLRRIEPPAVQRKKRISAEIIHLKLALNRAEHKHIRVAMAG